jgi:citrate lyase subunit beta/citryl-CoA lyase
VNVGGVLHDRASYRYWWQVIERAHRTGRPLGSTMKALLDA